MQTHYDLSSFLLICGFAASACVLNTRPGDGLASDGVSQAYEFGTATPSGGAANSGGLDKDVTPCKNVALFTQQVQPQFVQYCVECHDGTKRKAAVALFMGSAKSTALEDQQLTCGITLTYGVKLDDRLQSTVFTESDPDRPDLEHDFKFPDAASFTMYRDAVMIWLQTE